ncbi:MAG: stage sporulation protein [Bacillales bacterium]|nr:stage sporulation protein [Bacillales bacterium]
MGAFMQILQEFITNFVIFMLISIILDMLVPSSSYKKYTKLVIGLLLISLILSPILQLFHTDIQSLLSQKIVLSDNSVNSTFTKKIKQSESDINAANHAYILEQMAVQLKKDAEGELMKTFHYSVIDVHIKMKDETCTVIADNINAVQVVVRQGAQEVQLVKPVEVSFKESKSNNGKIEKDIRNFLEKRWGLNKKIIFVSVDT